MASTPHDKTYKLLPPKTHKEITVYTKGACLFNVNNNLGTITVNECGLPVFVPAASYIYVSGVYEGGVYE